MEKVSSFFLKYLHLCAILYMESTPLTKSNIGIVRMNRKFFDFWIFSLEGYATAAKEWNSKGKKFADEGELLEALECFTMAISIEPCCGESYFNRGKVNFDFAKYDEALNDYEAAYQNGYEKGYESYRELLKLHKGILI